MSKFSRFVGLLAVLVILTLALGGTYAQDANMLYLNWGEGDIPYLDPSYGTDSSSIQIIVETFLV